MIDLERWDEIKEIVQAALDLPAEQQAAYLEEACRGDEELRRQVEALLAVSATRADVYDNFVVMPPGVHAVDFKEGDEIGPYRIVRPLGTGGMSTVYLADDPRHERQVAIKVLRTLRRRRREEQTVARFQHPNIVTLYDSGQVEGGPAYFVMEYVHGETITTYCETRGLSVDKRLKLFLTVCDAVAYAHSNLVLHRDIKPANILVTKEGKPKLLDFGIAKSLSPSFADVTVTAPEDRALTVAFASPEQLVGKTTSTATDIYSLGVLLCLMLTGRLPYAVKSAHELAMAIRVAEPKRPSQLVKEPPPELGEERARPISESETRRLERKLRGDLDAIVLKTLRKEPDRRYSSVTEFAADVRRQLNKEPVSARRGSRRYRAGKFIRRHRYAAAGICIATIALITFLGVLFRQQQETLQERDNARRAAARAEAVSDFVVGMFRVGESENQHTVSAREILDNGVAQWNSITSADPALRGILGQALGEIYLNLGSFTPADVFLSRALPDLTRVHGPSHPVVVETLLQLARLHQYHGRYRQSEDAARLALRRIPADDLPSRTAATLILGHIAFARGDFAHAERLFRMAATLQGDRGGDPLLRAAAFNDLGCVLHHQGRLREAKHLYEKSLTMGRAGLGELHADVVRSQYNLARLIADSGQIEVAEAILRGLLLREVRALRPHDLMDGTLRQAIASILITKGEYNDADEFLSQSLFQRRQLLSYDHPDSVRLRAEAGRLAHSRKHLDEAETLYRYALLRLRQALGPNHPDTLVVANNLAVLAADRGRFVEADSLWRDLGVRVFSRPFLPHIRTTVASNVRMFEEHKRGIALRTEYRLLPISSVALSTAARPLQPLSMQSPARQARRPANKVLFFDDFSDGRIDSTKWEYGGQTVRETDGELRLRVDKTDYVGWARTRPIRIDPTQLLIIKRRVKVQAGNRYFDGRLDVNIVGYPDQRFGVSYANYHYAFDGECVTVGFSLFRYKGNSHICADQKKNTTALLEPIWGDWFEEEIHYDPLSGEFRYFLNGTERLVFNVGPLPPNATSITLYYSTWGWYTGHYQYLDVLSVQQ